MYGATVGKLSILSVEATFNQAALGMVAKETIGYPFVYLTLLRNRKQLVNLACGAAQQNLNAGNIKTYVSIIPPKHVMNDFNNVIMPIFDLIEKQNAESTRLSTLRDTLLPKLMSGQIKV
jgi:type I restriction enzyme S subunit